MVSGNVLSPTKTQTWTLDDLGNWSSTVIERYEYDAYGSCTVLDADHSSDADRLSDVENPYHFPGRRWDTERDLCQFRNRVMSPELGRFLLSCKGQ